MNEQVSYAIAYVLTCGLILAVGHFLQFDFVACVLVGMVAGNRVGWWLSKAVLYESPLPLTLVFCLGWGVLIGFALHGLFQEFNPGTIARIFAYGAGAYASIPNFGLFAEALIPAAVQGRHHLIKVTPFAAFVGISVWLALG